MGSAPLEIVVVCADELRGIDKEGARTMAAGFADCKVDDGAKAAGRAGVATLSSLSKKGLFAASTVRGGCARAGGEAWGTENDGCGSGSSKNGLFWCVVDDTPRESVGDDT